jgi:hypothetical protein
VSFTVTVNMHTLILLLASVAVQLTVVVPFGNAEPDTGAHTTLAPGQLSVALAVYITTAEQRPASVPFTIFAGHTATGGWVSFTVTVNEQFEELPAASITVQLTVVTPFANVAPDAGEHTGLPTPGQLSETVGAA